MCQLCGALMDKHGDHVAVCRCGGDMTRRHNRIRDTLADLLGSSGWKPDVEKNGLLPLRQEEEREEADPDHVPALGARSKRRPADVFVRDWQQRGVQNTGTAFDLAATSFMGGPNVQTDPGEDAVDSHLLKYGRQKRLHLRTEEICASQGLVYEPLVFEPHGGGWGKDVALVIHRMARRVDAMQGGAGSRPWGVRAAEHLAQRLSVVIQIATAQAWMRRSTTLENLA